MVTPAACACAAIVATEPPSEALRYQIHCPRPANAVPAAVVAVVLTGAGAGGGGGAGGCSAWVTTLIGPYVFDLCPPPNSTAISPECALSGTVTTRPCFEECRCALGELLAIRASHECGNATVWPLFRPRPCSSSVPCVETSWGLVEQLLAGTHCTAMIATAGCGGAFGFLVAGFFGVVDAGCFDFPVVVPGALPPL